MAEDETLNCPDCQMQLLQQQNCDMPMEVNQEGNSGLNPVVSKNNTVGAGSEIRTSTSHWEPMMSTMNRLESHHRNPDEEVLYCSSGRPIVNMNTVNANPMSTGGISYTTTSSYNSSANVALGPSTPIYSSSTTSCDLGPTANPCLTPIPEGCSGYCATCAVLELPSNECYYRAPLTRHAVFPPIFYNQPPPLPGFSPVPECSPWGGCNSNDFPPFSFPQYPQQTAMSDYFTNSSVVNTHASCTSSVDPNNSSIELSSSNANPTYPSPNLRAEYPEQNTKEIIPINENKDSDENSFPTSSAGSDDSSTTDSESLISQKELIVEDDDDDDSVSVSICNFDRNQKCVICQNSIVTDCSSPHLENILENIDQDITAEDLDITMSSADIEIGGIEDEVRCFHQKKINNSSAMQINLNRLAQLIGMPLNQNEFSTEVEQMVMLCSKCGKLAVLADSLEKQLNNTTHLLQESYYRTLMSRPCPSTNKSLSQPYSKERIVNEIYQTAEVSKQTNSENICTFKDFHAEQDNSLLQKQTTTVGTQTRLSENFQSISEPQSSNYSCSILDFENISVSISKKDYNEIHCSDEKFTTAIEILPLSENEKLIPVEDPESSCAQTMNDLLNENMSTNSKIEDASNIKSNIPGEVSNPKEVFNVANVQNSQSPKIYNKENVDGRIILDPNHESSLLSHLGIVTKENKIPSLKNYTRGTEFMCDVCGKFLSTKRSLLQHLGRHETQILVENRDITKNVVAISIENSPSIPLKDKSDDIPGKVINGVSHTIKVTNSCVTKEKYMCHDCGLSFGTQDRLDKHASKNCKLKSIQCEICDRRFSKPSELKVHLRVHAGEKPFSCNVCDLSFSTKGNQVAHSRTHDKTKRFICHICSKHFSRKLALEFHLNRHNGIKSFSCSTCKSSFYDPSNLINHCKKTHCGKMNFIKDLLT